jgi:integrase
MTKALTQAAIERMKLPATRTEVPDGLVAGLYLVTQPSGAKSWAVRGRVGGKSMKYTLGSYPTVPLKTARVLGREAILRIKGGASPLAEKREARRKAEAATKDTVRSICEEFLCREGRHLRTEGQRRAIFERTVYPVLGSRPIEAVSRTDIVRLLDKVEDERGPRAADLMRAYLGRVLNWYAARSDTFRSPLVRGMARYKEAPRSRVLSDVELCRVWDASGSAGPFGALVRFLLLTASRRGEAAGMKWQEVEGSIWTLPAVRSKTKSETVRPLSAAARLLLADVPQIGNCPFVFTVTGYGAIRSFGPPKRRLDQTSGVTGWRLHDLRRTSRSLMSRAGVSTDIAERCLGHTIGGVRGIYDRHQYVAEMSHAFEALAALFERIVSPPADNVRALRG